MEVYVLIVKNEGEIYSYVFKNNTQLKKKLIKVFNEEYNYDCEPEERDRMIEELIEHHYTTGDMLNDFAEYQLEKQILI